jgi:hypothetical protein
VNLSVLALDYDGTIAPTIGWVSPYSTPSPTRDDVASPDAVNGRRLDVLRRVEGNSI